MIGYSVTGTQDQGLTGEGLTANIFRELKPGVVDAMFDAFAPLRWCLFVEPVEVYRGRKARLEAVLANEDMLAPGDYPARFQVVGPRGTTVFDRMIMVKIADRQGQGGAAFRLAGLCRGCGDRWARPGKYRFLATFQRARRRPAATSSFMWPTRRKCPRWTPKSCSGATTPSWRAGSTRNGIKTRAFAPAARRSREVILVGNRPAPAGAEAFRELARHIARGSHAVFLDPEVFKDGARPDPLAAAGQQGHSTIRWRIGSTTRTIGRKIIRFSLVCPLAASSTTRFIARCLPTTVWGGQDLPAEVVAGSINTAIGYSSGLTVAVYRLGAGRVHAQHACGFATTWAAIRWRSGCCATCCGMQPAVLTSRLPLCPSTSRNNCT